MVDALYKSTFTYLLTYCGSTVTSAAVRQPASSLTLAYVPPLTTVPSVLELSDNSVARPLFTQTAGSHQHTTATTFSSVLNVAYFSGDNFR